jgi:hypothetical protein
MRTLGLGITLLSLCLSGLAQGEDSDEEGSAGVPGGFYFPNWDRQSKTDYVGVFPISSLSGYYVYGTGKPAQLVGEISGSPFVFHSGPRYCGWIGLPGLGWFGCGLHPDLPTTPARSVPTTGAYNIRSTSIRLAQGMSREEVIASVGSPSKKIQLGQKEIWEYTGYSLLFESGGLREIR